MSIKRTVVSFADMIATMTLPTPVARMVTAVLPPIADMIFDDDALEEVLKAKALSTTVTTQDGTTFRICVTPEEHPQVFQALRNAKERRNDGSVAAHRFQEFHGVTINGDKESLQGGVSILNGIIGVNW